MARIQILELPEGAADERPPFALIIDQARVEDFYPDAEDKSVWQAFQERVATEDPLQRIAEQLGARTVLVFEDTIDIPANQPSPTPNRDQGIPSGSTYQMTVDGVPLVWEVPQSEPGEATGIVAAHAVQRVRDLPERPDIPDWPQPEGYLNGYAAAIRAAKRALVEPSPPEAADG